MHAIADYRFENYFTAVSCFLMGSLGRSVTGRTTEDNQPAVVHEVGEIAEMITSIYVQ